MSRLGKIPIILPDKVEATLKEGRIYVKGPKGELQLNVQSGIRLNKEKEGLFVEREEGMRLPSKMHGLYRALVNNMIIGVSKGFEKKLQLVGIGYRAQVQGQILELQLGYSRPVRIDIPKGVSVIVDKSTAITIAGIDKQRVGQFAAAVRALRKPEPYKGKGVRYEGEYVRKKEGKKAAKGKGVVGGK